MLVLPADHPLTAMNRVHIGALADEIFVLPPRESSPSYFDQITSACRAAGFSPRVQFEVSSVVSQIAYVGCGLGIGMVPSRSMRFGGGDVVFRPLVETVNVVSIAAAWNPERRKDLVPEIITIAASIGADRVAVPIRTRPAAARALKQDDFFFELSSRLSSLFEHDLFRKPLHTFRDHALVRRSTPRLGAADISPLSCAGADCLGQAGRRCCL